MDPSGYWSIHQISKNGLFCTPHGTPTMEDRCSSPSRHPTCSDPADPPSPQSKHTASSVQCGLRTSQIHLTSRCPTCLYTYTLCLYIYNLYNIYIYIYSTLVYVKHTDTIITIHILCIISPMYSPLDALRPTL